MLNLVYDFIPLLLFFIAFKWYGIYVAVVFGMVSTTIQVVLSVLIRKKWDKQQLITLAVFLIFGSMTLYFHNPLFIKWKPTVIFWIFSLVLILSHCIGQKTLIQRMMSHIIEEKGSSLPSNVWKRLNLAWAVFFGVLGGLNLWVAYQCNTETWVNFKVYGVMSCLILFSIIQSIYLTRHLIEHKKQEDAA